LLSAEGSFYSLKLENKGRKAKNAARMTRGKATSDVEWDETKNRLNQKKHNVSFEEAATVFVDPLGITINDPDHEVTERRFISIGESFRRRLLVVSYTERANKIRIINGRKPTKRERRAYDEA
jgi:uncharacterized protein